MNWQMKTILKMKALGLKEWIWGCGPGNLGVIKFNNKNKV
jgi:hypothetical protein